jgi:hypothetical protein
MNSKFVWLGVFGVGLGSLILGTSLGAILEENKHKKQFSKIAKLSKEIITKLNKDEEIEDE